MAGNSAYVYVLTNPSMPGLVKIGMTTKSVKERIKELSSTGVPEPFQLYYACELGDDLDPVGVERDMHELFAPYRHNQRREFFAVDPKRVKLALKYAQKPKAPIVVMQEEKPKAKDFMPKPITNSLFKQLIESARGFRKRQRIENDARDKLERIPAEQIEEFIAADWADLVLSVNDTGTYFHGLDYALRDFYLWANDIDRTWECECNCCHSQRLFELQANEKTVDLGHFDPWM